MPRRRKKSRHYVVDQLQEDDPESYFKYVSKVTQGMSEEQSDFLKAVEDLSVQKVRSFLNKGMDPNFFHSHYSSVQDRVNVEPNLIPLHLAVSAKEKDTSSLACEKIVGVLLFFGADPNCKDRYGNSALHLASKHGNLAAARLLLEAGADVRAVNVKQETALMYVCHPFECKEHTADIVTLLLERGCPVNYANDKMKSALILLASDVMPFLPPAQRALVFKSLLKHGAHVNAKDAKGKSAYIYELERCIITTRLNLDHSSRVDGVQALVSAGAQLYDVDNVYIDLVVGDIDARPLLTLLKASVSLLLSQGQLRSLQALVQKMSLLSGNRAEPRRREDLDSLERAIENKLCLVPSLMQLSRIAVRGCLVEGAEERGLRDKPENKSGPRGRRSSDLHPQAASRCFGSGEAGGDDEGRKSGDTSTEVKAATAGSDGRHCGSLLGEDGVRKLCPEVPGLETFTAADGGFCLRSRHEAEDIDGDLPGTLGQEENGMEEYCAQELDNGEERRRREGRRRKKKRKCGMYEGVLALPLPLKMKEYLLCEL